MSTPLRKITYAREFNRDPAYVLKHGSKEFVEPVAGEGGSWLKAYISGRLRCHSSSDDSSARCLLDKLADLLLDGGGELPQGERGWPEIAVV